MIYRAFRYKVKQGNDIRAYDYSFGYFEGDLSWVSENACEVLYVALPSLPDGRPEWAVRGGHLDQCIIKVKYAEDGITELDQPVSEMITLYETIRLGIVKVVTKVEDTYGQMREYRSYGGGNYHILPTAKLIAGEVWIDN